MNFSTPIFLFLFLPLIIVVNWILPKNCRNFWLLIVSLLFYVWGETFSFWVVIASIILNYIVALMIVNSAYKTRNLVIGVTLNLLLLGWFKYANFLVDNFNRFFGVVGLPPLISIQAIHLPLGISFFTFHAISYLIDVKRGNALVQKNLLDFSLYILLFPQLIAGPIIRYKDIVHQLRSRNISRQDTAIGFQRFVLGLGKKMLIANPLGETADKIFAINVADLTGPVAWLGVMAYTLQIYFDFSGYSDMAIGLMRMLGFHIRENFDYPYISRSVREFWRRWHISLSTWFRDYVYIPLGGNRLGLFRSYFNLLIVFLLCGFWHGASWTFLAWGLWHGVFLVLERTPFCGGLLTRSPRPLQHLYALFVVIVGWVLFRTDTLNHSIAYLQAMAGWNHANPLLYPLPMYLDRLMIIVMVGAVVGSIPVWPWFGALYTNRFNQSAHADAIWSLAQVISMILIFILSVAFVTAGTYNPFIYFRF